MLELILNELNPKNIKLIAVTKTQSEQSIMNIYNRGHKIFGENRVQELISKKERLPEDVEWHLIGHLQTNKVKYIVSFVACIHSVDSLKVLIEIDKQAKKYDRQIDCLLQFHIAEEESKFGLDMNEARGLLSSLEYKSLSNARITGVMGMATFTENTSQVRREFKHLKDIFTALKRDFFAQDSCFREISMGMSGDYKIAIEEGSTMVRIGTLLFGNRDQ
jgi:pyridoxal phosphate enzyme (YggS family)